ncbi:hypothetical protein GCM10010256_49600 [Streptomyces coeruleorubidus]|nr:hypothetical protein GCM10010256_49600 [Streptomyces coeruleorubidus]
MAAGAAVAVEVASAGASVAVTLTANRGARRRLRTISILPVACSDGKDLSGIGHSCGSLAGLDSPSTLGMTQQVPVVPEL